jgi:hypothetical protein
MIRKFKENVSKLKAMITFKNEVSDELKLKIGKLNCSLNDLNKDYNNLSDYEFSVFSQFGDDGIIQYLINKINIPFKTFIEFGVEDYLESNTRFLLQNNNWSGFVMDGDTQNILKLKATNFFWKYDLEANSIFITKENISDLLQPFYQKWGGVGLLHIDLDGNDYWIWEKIELKPIILILEYNSVFGSDRAITVPYDPSFTRTKSHYSNLYWGSSLKSLYNLSISKGYEFVGCNSAGNNAYFVLGEYLNNDIKVLSLKDGFVSSKYRESRNEIGELTYLSGEERINAIKGLRVFNTEQNNLEYI